MAPVGKGPSGIPVGWLAPVMLCSDLEHGPSHAIARGPPAGASSGRLATAGLPEVVTRRVDRYEHQVLATRSFWLRLTKYRPADQPSGGIGQRRLCPLRKN